MRILDLHADLGMDILKKHQEGETDVLKNRHLDKLKSGEVMYTAAACFFEGSQSWEEMQEMVLLTREELQNSDVIWIKSPDDLDENSTKISLFLTIEGMCGIDADTENRIQWLRDQGCLIGSLCWNDENTLATGNGGNPARGLTPEGIKAVRKMNELNMVIDVSHANEKTFWDLIEYSEKPVIATHSNARALCWHDRNLTDQQIRALAAKGGLIGLNSWKKFIAEDPANQNALMLAKHARYMADLVGHQHIACGFDFMDFLGRDRYDISSADQAQNLIRGLSETGFSEEEIKNIAYRNAFRFLRENL